MKKGLYPVVFTMALSAFCAATITGARAMWAERIAALEAYERQDAILSALGLVPRGALDPLAVARVFSESVTVGGSEHMVLYEARDSEGGLQGLAFDVNGKGRNGDVFGVLALEADRRTIRDLYFYRHRETPGYGGKIGTPWFADMFVGKNILGPDGTPGFTVTVRGKGPRKVDAITGATQTTYKIVDVINTRIREFISGGRQLETIELELPRPVSSDIGLGIEMPDLVKPTGKKRPPLMVPEGTTNIALGKEVTSSDDWPIIGELSQAVDGEREAGFGQFVELMDGPQWLQIDLGTPSELFAILFWHEHDKPRVYFDVVVQLADDAEFARNVRTVFNNDRDNSLGLGAGTDLHYVDNYEGKLVLLSGDVARYVRLYSNNNHLEEVNRYTEVEIFGRPVPDADPDRLDNGGSDQ
jgi:Na+-transporting NADH:ubiquinone oxidoreductase subunit NqrC